VPALDYRRYGIFRLLQEAEINSEWTFNAFWHGPLRERLLKILRASEAPIHIVPAAPGVVMVVGVNGPGTYSQWATPNARLIALTLFCASICTGLLRAADCCENFRASFIMAVLLVDFPN
jgi:hypothetical protein